MVLALTMSSPTLLAGVVANYDFKENHTGYTLYFKQINDDKEARLMQLDIYNYDTEIVIPSVVKDTYGMNLKSLQLVNSIMRVTKGPAQTLAIWIHIHVFLGTWKIMPIT